MRKIILVCAGGMSTSILMKRMEDTAKEQGYEIDVSAHPVSHAYKVGVDADIILIGPQVRFQHQKVQDLFPEKPVLVMDMRTYGMMDSVAIIKTVKETLGD